MTQPQTAPAAQGIVVGAGPAGRALAQQLARLDVAVLAIDAHAERPWRTTWGLWDDEVERLTLHGAVAATATAPRVRLLPGEDLALERPYHVLDPERLRVHLSEGLQVRAAQVRAVTPATVELEDGEQLAARFVVDARGPSRTSCAQTAVGRVVRARGVPVLLMDFSLQHDDEDPRPSFGYVVPLDDEHLLVEETALAAAPPMLEGVLERRLGARLRELGLEGAAVVDAPLERVRIPLDVAPGLTPGGALRFGVAGGSVHPATGYALARTLEDAPVLARALAQALERGDEPERVARAAQRALWTPGRLAARRLFEHGRDVLLPLDLHGLRGFFRAFFHLPPARQRDFLSSSSAPCEVALAMASLWGGLSWPLRAGALGLGSGRAARARRAA